jgi:hypothetical protein
MANGNFIKERYVFRHELYLWNGVILSSVRVYSASSFKVCEINAYILLSELYLFLLSFHIQRPSFISIC